MPKKTQGRASRQRTRTQRPAPVGATSPSVVEDAGIVATTSPVVQRGISTTAPTRPSTRRPTAPPRAQPALTFNYTYLRRDIRSLALLAPAMIVLLIIAYFVLR